jgi:succinoglycan biosynthesis transport protein ExoP
MGADFFWSPELIRIRLKSPRRGHPHAAEVEPTAPEGGPLELRDYLRALKRSWMLMIVLAVIGAAGGFAYTALQKPSYAATAQTYVSARTAGSLGDAAAGVTYVQQAVASYASVATMSYVLKPVITGLKLDMTPAQLATEITTTTSGTTAVLEITATDHSASRAIAIANAVAKQLSVAAMSLTPESVATGGATAATSASIKLTVVDPAVAPATATGPSRALVIGGGAAGGVVLAVLIGLLRELLDTRIRTAEDVERATELPLLGMIRRDTNVARHPLPVLDAARSPQAESFRTLRTNLRYVELDDIAKSVVITSSIESEGKSTTAANLALAAADLGQRVLLVDADLRRPAVGSLFGIDESIGLSDVLIGQVSLDDAVQEVARSGLQVLPAGAVPPNPNEMLQSRAMTELLERLHAEYDLVVFDTPPLLPVSDAAVLGVQVGGVALVAASGQVQRAQLDAAIRSLERVNARVVGVIVTKVPRRGTDGYGYGYGLNAEQERRGRGTDRHLKTREA